MEQIKITKEESDYWTLVHQQTFDDCREWKSKLEKMADHYRTYRELPMGSLIVMESIVNVLGNIEGRMLAKDRINSKGN